MFKNASLREITSVHSLRKTASLALLGAVLVGVLVGWYDDPNFDPRIIGAIVGAVLALAAQSVHFI